MNKYHLIALLGLGSFFLRNSGNSGNFQSLITATQRGQVTADSNAPSEALIIQQRFATNRFPSTRIFKSGDLMVGGLFEIYDPPHSMNDFCGNTIDWYLISKAYSMIYAIYIFNQRLVQAYNITLGYNILPTCTNVKTAQLQSIILERSMQNLSLVSVVGPFSSMETQVVSPYLSFFRIPNISPGANAETFNDISRYKYLFRFMTDQKYYYDALESLLQYFGWSYVSMVWSNDVYNKFFANTFRSRLDDINTCIWAEALIPFIPDLDKREEVDEDLQRLVSNPNVRIVVLFLNNDQYIPVLKYIKSINYLNLKFIFIAFDTWLEINQIREAGLGDFVLGSLSFFEFTQGLDEFVTWMNKISKDRNLWNRYFAMDDIFENLTANTAVVSQSHSNLNSNLNTSLTSSYAPNAFGGHLISYEYFKANFHRLSYDTRSTIVIDIVSAIVIALKDLVERVCLQPRNSNISHSGLLDCIARHDLVHFIRNVSFTGKTGKIEITRDQKVVHNLKLTNLVRDGRSGQLKIVTVGMFQTKLGAMRILRPLTYGNASFSDRSQAPASRCSEKCGPDYYQVPTDLKCCWICRQCGRLERFSGNLREACLPCPPFQMTNLMDAKSCSPMQAIRLIDQYSTLNIFIVILSFVGLLIIVGWIMYYFKHYGDLCFKVEIRMFLHMAYLGLLLGFLGSILIAGRFEYAKCAAGQFCILLSFNLIYSATMCKLLLFSQRISITKAHLQMKKIERGIYAIFIGLLGFQIILCLVLLILERGAPYRRVLETPYDDRKLALAKSILKNSQRGNISLGPLLPNTQLPTPSTTTTTTTTFKVEEYCGIFGQLYWLRYTQFLYQLFVLLLCFVALVKLERLPPNYKEAHELKTLLTTLIALYLIDVFAYTFVNSIVSIVIYLLFYNTILYCFTFFNIITKVRAKSNARG